MKVIFLDIDNVLNHIYCDVKMDHFRFVIDDKLRLLKQLVNRTDAKIVLSSTWRFGWIYLNTYIPENDVFRKREIRLFLALQKKFREFGLEFLDRTPLSANAHRSNEIDQWLREWDGEPVESFVILDDLNGKYLRPHAGRLVRTSTRTGLLQKHVDLAVKLLENFV